MNDELETRLEEAFAAQAATTTTSDDAWARIQRLGAARDHRRSVVLRSVAAAVVAVLAVGGGVALFRDGGESGTVATGSADASKSIAEDSASSAAGGAREAAPAAPFVPAGNGLEVQQRAGGTIVTRFGSTTTEPVPPGGIAAAIDGETVFGVVPDDAVEVVFGVAPDPNGGGIPDIGLGGGTTFTVDGYPGARFFLGTKGTFGGTEDVVSVALLGGMNGPSREIVGHVIARRN